MRRSVLILCVLLALGSLASAESATDPESAVRRHVKDVLPHCRVKIHDVVRHGRWAAIYADCAGKEGDSVMNLFARRTGINWSVVCGFGDSAVDSQFARKTCKMPAITAKAFSLPY